MGSNDSVFGDSCQRGRKYEPKAKGPHHHQFQKLSFQEYYQLVSYYVQKGDIEISYINTKDQLADIFTKPLDEQTFTKLRHELNILDYRNFFY